MDYVSAFAEKNAIFTEGSDPYAEWSGLRTCPLAVTAPWNRHWCSNPCPSPSRQTSPLFNCTRLASSPLHAVRGSIMLSLLSAMEATRVPTTGR